MHGRWLGLFNLFSHTHHCLYDKEKQRDEGDKTSSFWQFALERGRGRSVCPCRDWQGGVRESGVQKGGQASLATGWDPDTLGEADTSWSSDLHPGVGSHLRSAGTLRQRAPGDSAHSVHSMTRSRRGPLICQWKANPPLSVRRLGWPAPWAVGDVPRPWAGQIRSLLPHSPLTSVGMSLGAEESHSKELCHMRETLGFT